MARIKKGAERKIPISFRLESKTIERLKKIDKFHSKIDVFINKGIDEYYKFLNKNSCENVYTKYNFLEILENDELRLKYIEELNKLNDYYDNEVFFKFHQELYTLQKSSNDEILRLLENWEETKVLFNKKIND